MAGDHWIDAAEAARRLGVKPATLYAYVSRGLLHRQRHQDGRRSLFDPAEVAALHARSAPRVVEETVTFVSAVTALGGDRPYFRGRDALDLARTSTYEAVAEWLWTQTEAPSPGWASRPASRAAAVAAQAAVPADALLLDRLQVIVTALAVSDGMRFTIQPDAVVTTARSLIAGMVDSLPARGRRKPAPGSSIAARLWPKLTTAAAEVSMVRLLDSALILLADHELAASTVAARVAASVQADPYAVVSAALGVVGGPMHGGASLRAERMLAQIASPRDAARIISDRLRHGERIPGIGHQVYKSGDARGTLLLELIREVAPRHPRVAVTDAVLAELDDRGLPAMNVDLAVATLAGVTSMQPGSGEAIFAIARTAGWLAHALEEYRRPAPLRPRASYIGRPIPEQPA